MHRLFRLTSFSVILLALLIAADVGAIAARAQDDSADGLDWGLTGLSDPVVRLFTPASGAFFAQTAMTFLRSDDGGSTWRSVSLGPATTILNVDQTITRSCSQPVRTASTRPVTMRPPGS